MKRLLKLQLVFWKIETNTWIINFFIIVIVRDYAEILFYVITRLDDQLWDLKLGNNHDFGILNLSQNIIQSWQ